jgi:thiol:disulfide interchange protein DsbD
MHPFLPIAAICCVSPLYAVERTSVGVDLTLVSEKAVIKAGETFTVGLKIHHQPHYHTYWRNPGIAGMPTTLKWQLPEGFTAGPIRWPVPQRTFMATHPVHGYERDVLLLVDITAPTTFHATQADLKAKAQWMACADGCYPGEQDLSLSLPVDADGKTDQALATDFAKARKELPRPLEGWTAQVLTAAGGPEIRIHFTPATPGTAQPEGLYFFSSDGQVSSDQPQTITAGGDGSFDLVAVRSEYSPEKSATLPGVLTTTTSFTKGGPAFASIEPPYAATAK